MDKMDINIQILLVMMILIVLFAMITCIVWWLYPFNTIEKINRYELLYKYKIVKSLVPKKDAKKMIELATPLLNRCQAQFKVEDFSSEMVSLVEKVSKALEVPLSSIDRIDINKITDDQWDWDIPDDSVGVYVLLNSKYRGGEIIFNDDEKVCLKVGDALFFRDRCSYSHCHKIVKDGEKWLLRIVVN